MRFIVKVTEPRARESIYAQAEQTIVGFGPPQWVDAYNQKLEDDLANLFKGHGPAPEATMTLAITDPTNTELYGAAMVETPYYEVLAEENPEHARRMATHNRILSGMFVHEHHRQAGVGSGVLRWAGHLALSSGARYLDGFVDDRMGAADFYRKAGATVCGHSAGLPGRSPTNSAINHVMEVNGHWFYIDLWKEFEEDLRCSRCRAALTFVDDDGGRMTCPNCGDPKDLAGE